MFAINVNHGAVVDGTLNDGTIVKDNFAGGPILKAQPDFCPAGNTRSYNDSCVTLVFNGNWLPNTTWIKKWAPEGKYYKAVNADAEGAEIADKYTYDLVTIPSSGVSVAVAPKADDAAAGTLALTANAKGRYQDLEIIVSGYKYVEGPAFWGKAGKYVDYQITKEVKNPIVGKKSANEEYTVTLDMKGYCPAGKKFDETGELVDDTAFTQTPKSLEAAKAQLLAGGTGTVSIPGMGASGAAIDYTIGKLRNAIDGDNEPDDIYVDYVWNADATVVAADTTDNTTPSGQNLDDAQG